MKFKFAILLFYWFISLNITKGQQCTTPGQTAATAFPVCGTNSFKQNTVPFCSNGNMPTTCSDGAGYQDKNPFWYKFTCFAGGSLGFQIIPNNINDDYDWELFDVTGHNISEVYTNLSLVISANWSHNSNSTGTSAGGNGNQNCSGSTPNQNSMPTMIVGHDYLLMVSHFDDTPNGYVLAFDGGTASITDPTNPSFKSARAICDGQTMTVKLNKKMKCSSLTANGSDFTITPNRALISSAFGVGCSTGFDTDSIILSLASPLPPGSYNIIAQNGSDGNTMLDNCGTQIPVGDNKAITVLPQTPTLMDSITPIACAPNVLQLVFKKPMRCNSVAADGSDFRITGPSNITVSSASGVCDSSGTGTTINVFLATPISVAGNYTITLKIGTDGNTVINECGQPTAAGSFLNFTGHDTVSAKFTYHVNYSCLADTITCFHNGKNGIISWAWAFDNRFKSNLQNPPAQIYISDGPKNITLAVSNGFCADTANINIQLTNTFTVKAGIIAPTFVCPNDTAVFKDSSQGKILNWAWDFGNGNISTMENPPPQYFQPTNISSLLTVKLIVSNASCADTTARRYTLVNNCYVDVPTGFTPNGDGLNDYLYPLNAYKADNLMFRVYNRTGQLLYETRDWTLKWDGRYHGELQPTGAYIWMLQYTDHDTGKKYNLSGTSVLIR